MTKLKNLQLGNNDWTGTLPTELGLLSANLVSLGLSESKLTGSIPSEILFLTNLENLYLHSIPGLEGHIVDELDDIQAEVQGETERQIEST